MSNEGKQPSNNDRSKESADMSPEEVSRNSVVSALSLIAKSGSKGDIRENIEKFRHSILLFGSESEGNLQAARSVEYITKTERNVTTGGLGVRPAGVHLSDIIYCVESEPMPAAVAERFPQLTTSEWEAAMRIMVLLLKALERRTVADD